MAPDEAHRIAEEKEAYRIAEEKEAYRIAEEKIEEARRSGVKELDLSAGWRRKAARLAALPESVGQLTQLESLALSGNQLIALPESLSHLTRLQSLDLSDNQLTALPEPLSHLTQLQSLNLSGNRLTPLPEWLGQLTQLTWLSLSRNRLTVLPESLGQLTHLQELRLSFNRLIMLPQSVGRLTQLQSLDLHGNELTILPESIGLPSRLRTLDLFDNYLDTLPNTIFELKELQSLDLGRNCVLSLPDSIGALSQLKTLLLDRGYNRTLVHYDYDDDERARPKRARENSIRDLPSGVCHLPQLRNLNLDNNPLNPELTAAYKEGLDAVKRYLRAKAEAQVVLNEAKLILIGEGEVGKSALLGALRGDDWVERRVSTHGIDIKPVKVTDPATGTEITLNGWDFGGQRVYRPTHQLFFSAPAVYLVVWKPREGPQQGFVKEWIKLVKNREPDAKILVVATHGGPGARQPDIDRQEIWDLFGKERVIDFFYVDSRPSDEEPKTGRRTGVCQGIEELKEGIARVAVSLPEVGREVPKHWQDARAALTKSKEAYLLLDRVFAICKEHNLEEEDAHLLLRICRRVGDLIHYEHDPALHDIVVLKPDWLATAMSFVLDDKQTRDAHGLISFKRLGELWNDPARATEFRYDARLHPLFMRLMERFDLSYKVTLPKDATDEIGFWERVGGLFKKSSAAMSVPEIRYTSLVAQLVPDVRPEEGALERAWPSQPRDGEEQQLQICRIVDAKNGQSASAEGLFFQLIVRLHRFSLGRADFKESAHWQRGLLLDDEYNGRALLEHVGNDVRITVRAGYPEKFLSVLTHEVEYLIENFWEGLRCDVMVPCVEPCGRKVPGTGLFEVEKLIRSKKRGEYPCPVCNEWQSIDCLLRNAPAARRTPVEVLIDERFNDLKLSLTTIRKELITHDRKELLRFRKLNQNDQRVLSEVDDLFGRIMRAFTDEAKDGPRLFSLQPVERSAFNPNGWVKKKFRVTLWCEHTRLPVPLINKHDKEGVYEFDVTREWFAKAAPVIKVLTATLSLVLPVAASATKMVLDEAGYKSFESQLDIGKDCVEAMLSVTEKTAEWLAEKEGPGAERAGMTRADGGVLREFQTWLKKEDPSFGDLRRVLNKRQEFLWVHRDYEKEY